MPRIACEVLGGSPHHVTQRGNRRESVFFIDEDRYTYLKLLREYCGKYAVDILAYCLMTNHVHLVAVPKHKDGLQRVLKPLHMRYAQYFNRKNEWSGHLWQGRFFSSPLDDDYLGFCVRYVERNPVRAGMVERAENYPWSSAAAHCGLRRDKLLSTDSVHLKVFEGIRNWSAWLHEEEDSTRLGILRRNIQKNLPCGSDAFVTRLERLAGRLLRFRPIGRTKNG